MRRSIALALIGPLAACSASWPPAVGGGMAETAPPPAASGRAIDRHLACSVRHLDVVVRQARTTSRLTGQADVLELEAARARREVAGGLTADADRTLTRVDHDTRSLAAALAVPAEEIAACLS